MNPKTGTRDTGAERRAVIDIGSNSVKLLIGTVEGKDVTPLVEKSTQTRLNKGLSKGIEFDLVSIRNTQRVLRRYIKECIALKTTPPLLFATSAARRAAQKSFNALSQPIWTEFGLAIHVISPAQEAKWAFKGSRSEAFGDAPVLLTDVGGGSAQFTIGWKGKFVWSRSCPLGAVQLLEEFPLSDPPTQNEMSLLLSRVRKTVSELRTSIESDETVKKVIPNFSIERVLWIGSGGAATILASMRLKLSRFNRSKLEGTELDSVELQEWVDRIWSLPLEERKLLPGLPSQRADITLTGTAVYLAIMQVFAFNKLHITTRGGRYGALLERTPYVGRI